MLENLHVKNLALIDEAEINFGSGFNVLTGETGAGKSIVLGSIGLALGAKTNADIIRTGCDSALVELSFSLDDNQVSALREREFDIDDSGELILQRKITPQKSVCRINGETISMGQLKELSEILLDVYGQHEHQTLLKASTYGKMLDKYAGNDVFSYLHDLKTELTKYKSLKAELASNDHDQAVRAREIELLKFEIEEITNANLRIGEDEELESRYRFLNNAHKIMEVVSETHSVTGNDSDVCAGNMISHGVSRLRQIASLDGEASELLGQLTEIEDLLSDFNRALNSYEESLNFDQEEYIQVEDRLNYVNRLKDKYGDSIEKILESLEKKEKEMDRLENYETYLDKLNADIQASYNRVISLCKKISELRKKASEPLTDSLIKALKDLNFLDVKLNINITSSEDSISLSGYDNVEFLISLNPGEEMKPIQNIASGGELSRIMLAFKSVFAENGEVKTLIFDEIDAGISGVTAYKVAEKMSELSKNHQLLCISHLPQIAAMADTHFLIEKNVVDGRTLTNIGELSEDDSIKELARMLGADVISEAALENARELKKKR